MQEKNATPVVLITGAAKRLGAAMATYFHEKGFAIGLHYHHSADAAKTLKETLEKKRADSVLLLPADLADIAALQAMIASLKKQWGRLDLLVNNASAFYPKDFIETTEAEFDDLLNSNVKGAYFLTQAAVPLLRAAEGSVVNILDAQLKQAMAHYSAYLLSKAALAMLTKALAIELAPTIRVNAVAPGGILWPVNNTWSDQKRADFVKKIPMQRLGTPEEVAEAVYFLATGPRYITGDTLTLDGARS